MISSARCLEHSTDKIDAITVMIIFVLVVVVVVLMIDVRSRSSSKRSTSLSILTSELPLPSLIFFSLVVNRCYCCSIGERATRIIMFVWSSWYGVDGECKRLAYHSTRCFVNDRLIVFQDQNRHDVQSTCERHAHIFVAVRQRERETEQEWMAMSEEKRAVVIIFILYHWQASHAHSPRESRVTFSLVLILSVDFTYAWTDLIDVCR